MTAHVDERLSPFLDGELPAAERAAIERHLAGCERCATHLAELAAVDAAARQLPVEAPAGYHEALPGRVRFRLEAERRRSARAARGPLGLPGWAWSAAAATVVGALSVSLLRTSSPARRPLLEPVPPAAAVARPAQDAPAVPAATVRPAPRAGEPLPPPPTAAPTERGRAEADRNALGRAAPAAPPATRAPAPGFVAEPPAATLAGGVPTPLASALPRDEARRLRRDGADAKAAAAPATPAPERALAEQAATKREAPEARTGGTVAKSTPAAAEAAVAGNVATAADAEGVPAATAAPDRVAAQPAVAEEEFAPSETRFRELLAQPLPRSVAEARARHAEWQRLAAALDWAEADEARARAVEAAALVHRLSGDEADRVAARAEARAYLAREDARQRPRVERVLASLAR